MTDPPAGARVLVTGGTGFIGRRLVRRLVDAGCRVSCLVRRTSSTSDLRAWGAQLLTSDLSDVDAVRRLIASARPAVVFHVAGLVRALRESEFIRVNVQGTDTVAQACARCAQPPVLVVISSLAAAGPSSDDRPRMETDEPRPISTYGRSKHQGELAAAKYANDVPVTIVRPPIVFGPEDQSVLQMVRPIGRWGVHPVPRAGAFRLSMVHVDDLMEGLIRVWMKGERMRASGATGSGVYFLAAREHLPYVELGQVMARALELRHVRVVRIPAGLVIVAGGVGDLVSRFRRRPGWINSDKVRESLAGSWICCSARAQRQLAWEPKAPLEQRLRDTVRWYRQAGWL